MSKEQKPSALDSTIEEKAEITTQNTDTKKCLNCGTELQGAYCHACGQQAENRNAHLIEFILEYINNAFLWDPTIFKTLWHLVRRPGFLTNEFNSGKYISYTHPLKLNMFVLFIFVTLFVIFADSNKTNSTISSLSHDETFSSSVHIQMLMDDEEYVEKMKNSPRDTVLMYTSLFVAEICPDIITKIEVIEDSQGESFDKWVAVIPQVLIEDEILKPDADDYYIINTTNKISGDDVNVFYEVWQILVDLVGKYFPMIVLLTSPFLSSSLRLMLRRKKIPYINHFIFSLHYIAFLELLITFIFIITLIFSIPIGTLEYVLAISSCIYLTAAFRKVYKTRSWFTAFIASFLTSLIYLIIGFMALIAIFLAACFIVASQL